MWTLIKLVAVALNIIAIADVISKYKDIGTRVVLIVMILAFPIVGAAVYLLIFRPKEA
ncbi:MAG: PLDc N-terminal domain-containing protein [Acidobacteriota bacterium]|nr:PLDc N-terminal domain-containing protein [Blastocatellia bacterium]MDW8238578.1 PLDc N-terminal domain-containing protein [Acidobacteriota bacterium]